MCARLLQTSFVLALSLLAPAAARASDSPVIDGDPSDWSPGVTVVTDADDVRLKLILPDEYTLQAAPVTIALRVDLDGDPGTGAAFGDATGVDLAVIFSPPYKGEVGNGVKVLLYDAEGEAALPPSAVDLLYAPTYASAEFEVRLSRTIHTPWDETLSFAGSGTLRWWLTPLDGSGNATALWCSGSGELVEGGPAELSDDTLPPSPDGALRVASMNVLWASPMQTPAPFSRLITAIDADVWLFQEWDIRERDQPRIPAEAVAEWLNRYSGSPGPWTVVAGDQRGVLVASRLPLTPAGPGGIKATAIGDRRAMIERSVRYVSATAETPIGTVLIASVHLKCCGTRGDESDRKRMAEAVAVNAAMHEAADRDGADAVVIGGDFNLVGTVLPRAIIASGLDRAGHDLVTSGATVLGDEARYTWTDAGNRFPAGSLDYLLTSPSSARVAGAWILDTARLSDSALGAMGLERTDSAATDHRPLVVDLVRP